MYQQVKKQREQYKEFEVDIDDIHKINVVNRVYPKECFGKSWDYIVHSFSPENLILVHGSCVVLVGLAIGHAWVEIGDDIVFEGVYQRFYDKEKYYKARSLVKYFEYRVDEVRKLSWEHKHKGPWESVDSGNCFDFYIP